MAILLGILSSFNKNKIHRQSISKAKKYHVSEASGRFFKCASTSPFCHYCHFGKCCEIGQWTLSALFEIDDGDDDDDDDDDHDVDGNAFDKQFRQTVGLGSSLFLHHYHNPSLFRRA